ncbi:MAG: type VI secretion system baseplate subunit TssF [Verrucomicrobiia bacterium]|jgi:type VI secretion system protein ImpG|tara:strand:- start:502 stop:2382 length:1881 start_codon:yes stop_codon:yes gene_type:complete
MNSQFISYYKSELQYIRSLAGEFAEEYPKIASRLAISKDGKEECPDPFVERLLEGFAFLTARVQLKFDSEFPNVAQSILDNVYPLFLAPTPSMLICKFYPELEDSGLAEGYKVPKGTQVKSRLSRGERTPCIFSTSHDLKLWPLVVEKAEYYSREIGTLELPKDIKSNAAISISLKTTAGLSIPEVGLDVLEFHVRGTSAVPDLVLEQLFSRCENILIRQRSGGPRSYTVLKTDSLRQVGLASEESLLPRSTRGYDGYRLLREFFTFPSRYHFFQLCGLKGKLDLFKGGDLDIVFLLNDEEISLTNSIDRDTFQLHCVPSINLFPKRADRMKISKRFDEFPVVVDKTRSLDYEVYEIREVVAHGTQSEEAIRFRPFYFSKSTDSDQASAHYSVRRRKRRTTAKERQFGKTSKYEGSETYISLVDLEDLPYSDKLDQLAVKVLCSNRHLPISLSLGSPRGDFVSELSGPIDKVECLSGPSEPIPSFIEEDLNWRLINHLSLTYFSLVDGEEGEAAAALRDSLRLYGNYRKDLTFKRMIDGLVDVNAKPIIRRVPRPGPIAFARGLEVTLLFDENLYEGTGIFVLGSVMSVFLQRLVTVNSFIETVICSKQRGELKRWRPVIGKIPIL